MVLPILPLRKEPLRIAFFSSNNATSNGGAVSIVHSGSIGSFNNCKFAKNHARSDGGALSIFSSGEVNVVDSNFQSNIASNNGGVFENVGGVGNFRRCNFTAKYCTDGWWGRQHSSSWKGSI